MRSATFPCDEVDFLSGASVDDTPYVAKQSRRQRHNEAKKGLVAHAESHHAQVSAPTSRIAERQGLEVSEFPIDIH